VLNGEVIYINGENVDERIGNTWIIVEKERS
jgi:hypothetical protein